MAAALELFRPEVDKALQESLKISDEEWSRWKRALTTPPLWTVIRVNTHLTSPPAVKDELERFLLECYTSRNVCPPPVHSHPVVEDLLVIPIRPADPSLAPAAKHVVVGVQCGMAVLRGANVFSPGVMAADPSIQQGDEVAVFADVERSCRRGLTKRFDGKTLFVGNGRAEISRYDLFHKESPSGVAVTMTTALYDSPPLNGELSQSIFLQNFPSALAAHVVGPQPGETVLDMCAAPGGKTTHLASLMNNKGVLIALDKSAPKVERIQRNCQQLNVSCVSAYAFDSTKVVRPDGVHEPSDLLQPPFPPAVFDRILLDAPCSALGQRPVASNRMSLKELQSYVPYQRKLFSQAVQLLRCGGVLVYCTCTFTLAENEELVSWALRTYPILELAHQEPHLGEGGWQVHGLSTEQARLLQRFPVCPQPSVCGHPDTALLQNECVLSHADTIGFFIAKFLKKG